MHCSFVARGAAEIILARKNAKPRKPDTAGAIARNDILRTSKRPGRTMWRRWSVYHSRSRDEAGLSYLKSFGERIAVMDPDRQTAEIHIRVALMNRIDALGTAENVRMA